MNHLNIDYAVDVDKTYYRIYNKEMEFLGKIERIRVGRWMSWCLLLEQDCYLSAGCLDEVREKIRELNNKK